MAAKPEHLEHHQETEAETETETGETREVYLRDGRKLTVAAEGQHELVEIRGSGGQLELRIVLTEQGPILKMDAVRLELKAEEAVSIDSKRVEIHAQEEVAVTSDAEVNVEGKADVRVRGKMIWLN
ncbi:MAG TPA: hypothetical protein VGM88_00645 [Kofleriaceae bacterium]|jgi:hypothetical protein